MKMIAIHTIHGRKLVREAGKDGKQPAKYKDALTKPGEEFDTDELGIDDEEAQDLVARGAARRKTREVPDDGAGAEKPAA
jgi:hypothetical protein